jgi:hypothetical protein
MHILKTGIERFLCGLLKYMEHLSAIDACPSLNDIMGIRRIKCNRSEQVYDFKRFGVSCLVDNI